jgi:hypothetical protein
MRPSFRSSPISWNIACTRHSPASSARPLLRPKPTITHHGVFSVEYATKSGLRRVSLYGGGFPRIQTPLLGFVDILPELRDAPRPKELFFRMKATRCELCGARGIPVSVHQVRNLKSLTGQWEWERTMLKMRRKTLVFCEPCHAGIHTL